MRTDHLTSAEIEAVLLRHMPSETWMTLPQLYGLVERHASLFPADWDADAPGSTGVRWQRNVRNVLQSRKSLVGDGGLFEWDPRRQRYKRG